MDTDLRNKIDRIWEYFWTGGITNPLSVIEQITYLLFIKGLDDIEIRNEKDDVFLGITSNRIFDVGGVCLRTMRQEKCLKICKKMFFLLLNN